MQIVSVLLWYINIIKGLSPQACLFLFTYLVLADLLAVFGVDLQEHYKALLVHENGPVNNKEPTGFCPLPPSIERCVMVVTRQITWY